MRAVAGEGLAPAQKGWGEMSPGLADVASGEAASRKVVRALPDASAGVARNGLVCALCGAQRVSDSSFCVVCGSVFGRAEVGALAQASAPSRPGFIRRALAAIIDRLVPLPFVAYLFPVWGVLVCAYHLLCDGAPSGRSVGKRASRLRVVRATSLEPCGVARSVLRRLGPALCQLAYCSWKYVWLAVVYELVSLTFVLLNPSGRRPEDYLAGTLVITERAYRRMRKRSCRACASCGAALPERAQFCPRCGMNSVVSSQ
jgi:uncharacterized RDD family membrane protein YckC